MHASRAGTATTSVDDLVVVHDSAPKAVPTAEELPIPPQAASSRGAQ
jgi:hypothetical protein